jgi:hypothetical protein
MVIARVENQGAHLQQSVVNYLLCFVLLVLFFSCRQLQVVSHSMQHNFQKIKQRCKQGLMVRQQAYKNNFANKKVAIPFQT